jgi:hypothetical protein
MNRSPELRNPQLASSEAARLALRPKPVFY